LTTLSNALRLAMRRGDLKANPLAAGRLTPWPKPCAIAGRLPQRRRLGEDHGWLRNTREPAVADLVAFLAYSGLRIGEALPLSWAAVNLGKGW